MNIVGIFFLLLTKNTLPASRKKEGEKKKFTEWKGFLVLLGCMMLGGVVYRGATVTLPALFERNLPTV
ncbi:MAG: hypothetical protein D3903_03615 [Candidatus Electrothrix sp. GM3_4]|nr:hypothetical protein [Candidatus Electrothrix sp. GM3_4]